MGTDTALAVLSDEPRLLYDYFKQLFAQVTNPPLDAIREELVTSMGSTIGPERNLLEPEPRVVPADRDQVPDHPQRARGEAAPPAARRRRSARPRCRCCSTRRAGRRGLEQAMDDLCRRASEAVAAGYDILILSDRGVGRERRRSRACSRRPACTITWCARARARAARSSSSRGDAREVHHVSLLLGYGAGVVNPYVAFETIDDMIRAGHAHRHRPRQGESSTTSRRSTRAC